MVELFKGASHQRFGSNSNKSELNDNRSNDNGSNNNGFNNNGCDSSGSGSNDIDNVFAFWPGDGCDGTRTLVV